MSMRIDNPKSSVVRRFSGPKIQWFDNSLVASSVVWRFSGPNVQYSDASVVRMFSGHTVNWIQYSL